VRFRKKLRVPLFLELKHAAPKRDAFFHGSGLRFGVDFVCFSTEVCDFRVAFSSAIFACDVGAILDGKKVKTSTELHLASGMTGAARALNFAESAE